MEKGCGRALGLAEERTQARGRLFLGDFLFFLLFLFLLLFFLLGGRRCRGSGGWEPDGGLYGPLAVPTLHRARPGFNPGLAFTHSRRRAVHISRLRLRPPPS